MATYMVIERFKAGCMEAVYERFEARGRLLPDGLIYHDSWVDRKRATCFQLMHTDRPELFDLWFDRWSDLVDFELFEVD